MLRKTLALTLVLTGVMGVVLAGNYDRRFARISYIEGNLVFRHGDDPDWSAGGINTPLQERDRLYVPLNSRAEIEFDDGSFLRLAEDTEIRIVSLDPQGIRIELPIGLATLRYSSRLNFEVLSPAGSFRALQEGVFRLEVTRDGSLDVIVRKGTAEIVRSTETLRVRRREALSVPLDATAHVAWRPADSEDVWDHWNDRRDASSIAYSSRRYLPSDVYIGVPELDYYGSWVSVSGYGYGWRPLHVSVGWSPYRHGRWVHRPYWGWTWVSYEPWGWLPYHHGRWYYDSVYNWCWLPYSGFGRSYSFHYWSPGLVHFYRYRGGLHWLPLGPRDHHVVNNYFYNVTQVNHTTIQNIQNVTLPRDRRLQNADVDGALVSVSERGFLGDRGTDMRLIPTREIVAQGQSLGSARDLSLQPSRDSRSPRPEIDVTNLRFVDAGNTRAEAAPTGERRMVPSVRPVGDDTSLVGRRDIGRGSSSSPSSGLPRSGRDAVPEPGSGGERRIPRAEDRSFEPRSSTGPDREGVPLGGGRDVSIRRVPSERRSFPSENPAGEVPRPDYRRTVPGGDSRDRRIVPEERRSAPPEVRSAPSPDFGSRDSGRDAGSWSNPRVRVIRPDSSSRQGGSPPVYVIPGRDAGQGGSPAGRSQQIERGGPERGSPPPGATRDLRSQGSRAPQRDRPSMQPSGRPAARSAAPPTRRVPERRPPPEKRPPQ